MMEYIENSIKSIDIHLIMKEAILQLYRTSTTNVPNSEDLEEGELAIGMNKDKPRIYTLLTDNTIGEFVDKSYIDTIVGDINIILENIINE